MVQIQFEVLKEMGFKVLKDLEELGSKLIMEIKSVIKIGINNGNWVWIIKWTKFWIIKVLHDIV